MPATTTTRPAFVIDRAGVPRFTSHAAAQAWLNADPDHALQCPDCTWVPFDAELVFGCCGQNAAIPVRPARGNPDVYEAAAADELTSTAEGA